MNKKVSAKVVCTLLMTAMVIAVLPKPEENNRIKADGWERNGLNTYLCVTPIENPQVPKSANDEWTGSYVYFGHYDDSPVFYRVLDKDCTKFGGDTLFLDSDLMLFYYEFGSHYKDEDNDDAEWGKSGIRTELNGSAFLNKEGVFTDTEKKAIFSSKIKSHDLVVGSNAGNVTQWTKDTFGKYVELTGEKIFLLDAEDVSNPAYGYYQDDCFGKSTKNRIKTNRGTEYEDRQQQSWWLRSDSSLGVVKESGAAGIPSDYHVKGALGFIETNGSLSYGYLDDFARISPALNIDKKQIVLSQDEVNGYSLTLKSDDLVMSLPSKAYVEIKESAGKVTPEEAPYYDYSSAFINVPYSLKGTSSVNNVDQLSFMILDKEYTEGNTNDATMLYYERIKVPSEISETGEGGFRFPKGLDLNGWGKDYYVYAIAEDLNYMRRTDYCSAPVEIKKPDGIPASASISLNKDTVKITCGKTATIKATVEGSDSAVTWESSDKKVATVNSKGKITAKQAGQATIKATVDGVTATCTVTVLYKDVTDTKDFWYNPTNYLTAAGVVKGYDKQTKFKPGNDCTRAQMVTFLWRLQGEPAPKSSTCKFKDVKKDDYFFKPVIWAVENGITTGVSKTKFNPQGVCTRAQTVTFLWRMADKPDPKSTKNKFKDVRKKDYFYKPVLWASEQKIVAGYKDGTFKPQGKCLRRQMVTFLYKYDKFVNGKG